MFGGDSFAPQAAVAYAWQARRGLARSLRAEIADGTLNKSQAARLALRFMRDSAYVCFDALSR